MYCNRTTFFIRPTLSNEDSNEDSQISSSDCDSNDLSNYSTEDLEMESKSNRKHESNRKQCGEKKTKANKTTT